MSTRHQRRVLRNEEPSRKLKQGPWQFWFSLRVCSAKQASDEAGFSFFHDVRSSSDKPTDEKFHVEL